MFVRVQDETDSDSDSDIDVPRQTIMMRKKLGSALDVPVVSKLEVPLSVKAVISRIEQAQLFRAREDIHMQLNDILNNVRRVINRYNFFDMTSPSPRKSSLIEYQRKRRNNFFEQLTAHAKAVDIRQKTLAHILAWLEEWNAILSELTTIDIDEHHHWIAQMELLPDTLKAIEGNVKILCRASTSFLEEKKKQRKKILSRGTLWKSWKDRVTKRPATAHALRPDLMISDQFATNTKVSEIQDMLQELIGTAMFSKLENNAIKYISSTVLNLSKALVMLNDELKVTNLQSSNMYVDETVKAEKEVSLKIMQDLSEQNEMLQQKLQDAEEKYEQVLQSKLVTGQTMPTFITLKGRPSPQPSTAKVGDIEDSVENILAKEFENIIDESQRKGAKSTVIKWDSAISYTAQGEMTPGTTEQPSKDTTGDKMALQNDEAYQKDAAGQYRSQKRRHMKDPHPHETSEPHLSISKGEQKVSEAKPSLYPELQALEKKRKDMKLFPEVKLKAAIDSKSQHFFSTEMKSQDGKGGTSSTSEQPKKGKPEYLLGKGPTSSESKVEPTTEAVGTETKSKTGSLAEPFRTSLSDSTSEPQKVEIKGKKQQVFPETSKEGTIEEKERLSFTKQAQPHLLIKPHSRISKDSFVSPDVKSQQGNLELFQKAILAFLKKKIDNVGKPSDKESVLKEEELLKKAEVEKLGIIKAKTEEYFQKVAEIVTKALRKYKDLKNKGQIGEKLLKQEKEISFMPGFSFRKPTISTRSELSSFLLNETADPVVNNLIHMILAEMERERDEKGHKEKEKKKQMEYLQESQEKVRGMSLEQQVQEEHLRKESDDMRSKHLGEKKASYQMKEGKQEEQKQDQWQEEETWDEQNERLQKWIRQDEKQKQREGEKEEQKPRHQQLEEWTQRVKEQRLSWEKSEESMRQVQKESRHQEMKMIGDKDEEKQKPRKGIEDLKKQGQVKAKEKKMEDLTKMFTQSPVKLSPRRKSILKYDPKLYQRTKPPSHLKLKSFLDEKHTIPVTPPTSTQPSPLSRARPVSEEPLIEYPTLTPEQLQALGITLTPQQVQAMEVIFSPEMFQSLGITVTPEQAQALRAFLTREYIAKLQIPSTLEQAQELGTTLTLEQVQAPSVPTMLQQAQVLRELVPLEKTQAMPIPPMTKQAQIFGIPITQEEMQSLNITLTAQQAQDLGITLTPQQAQDLGITLTPQQAQDLGITLTPQQAQDLGITLTPQQAQDLGITLTPQQAQDLGITLTPQQAQDLGITLTPQQAQDLGITLTPQQAQDLGITLTPQQAQDLGITLTPQQAQDLGITLTPQQAQDLGITLTPQQAQDLGITLTPQQAQDLGITLAPQQAQDLGITLTPQEAQDRGITVTPQEAQDLGITLTPQEAQGRRITVTPQEAQDLGITLTPQQAQDLGITLTPQQAQDLGITVTPQQAQDLGITLTPQEAQDLGITLTPQEAQDLGITLTPQQAQDQGITVTPQQPQAQEIALTPQQPQAQEITLTPQQAQAQEITLTPQQLQAQEITLTPQQAQDLGITLTPQQAQAQEITLTPQQPQAQEITLTPQQTQDLGITLTPQQPQAQEITLTPQQTQDLGITLTPQHAQDLGITVTPQQPQAQGITVTPQQAQAQGITVTPQQAQAQGITVTPQQAQAQGITVTPQQAQAQGITVTPQQAQAQGITVTPQQAQAQGITVTPQQAQDQGITLTPQQAQALGITVTPQQAQAQGITVTPQQAQDQGITLTPQQAQALGITLTPQQAQALGITLTPQQAQALGITLTPQQAQAQRITLTPQQAQAQGITLTPQQAQAQGITLTPQQAQALGITLTPQQAQALGITLTPQQAQAQGITLTPQQAQALGITLTPQQAQALGITLTPQQAQALGITLTPQQAQALGITLTPQQAQAQGITLTPQQAQALGIITLTPQRAQALGITLTPQRAQAQGITLTPQRAQAQGITLTPQRAQAQRITLTPQQAQAQRITLTPQQAQAQRITLTPQQAQAQGITLTPQQAWAFGATITPLTSGQTQSLQDHLVPDQAQELMFDVTPEEAHTPGITLTHEQPRALGITLTPEQEQALKIPLTEEKAWKLGVSVTPEKFQGASNILSLKRFHALGITPSHQQAQALSTPLTLEKPATWAPFTLRPRHDSASLPVGQSPTSRSSSSPRHSLPSSALTAEKFSLFGVSLTPLQKSRPSLTQAPFAPGKHPEMDILSDPGKLLPPQILPASREILVREGRITPGQSLTPEIPPTAGQLPLFGAPPTPRQPLELEALSSGQFVVPRGPHTPQPPLISQSPLIPGKPPVSTVPSTSGQIFRRWAPLSPGKPLVPEASSVTKERLAIISSLKSKPALVHPTPDFKASQAPSTPKKFQISEVSDASEETQMLRDTFAMEASERFQSSLTSYRTRVSQTPYIRGEAFPTPMKPKTSLPSLIIQQPQIPQILPSEWDQKSRFPPIDKPSVSRIKKPMMVPPSSPQEFEEKRYCVDVEDQRKNLILLNQATKTSRLPLQHHITARNLIIETLHMDTVQLGYLFRKYIAYRLIQRARNNIIKRLKAIQNTGKGYETQNLYIVLSRLDDYQKKVMRVWTEKQKSLEQKRNQCLRKMTHFFSQLQEIYGVNLSQPIPLITGKKQIPSSPKFVQRPFLQLLIEEDKKSDIFKKFRRQDQLEAIWNADLSTSSYPITEKTSIHSLWAQLGGYPDIPKLLQLDIQSTFRKSLATIQAQSKKIPK